MDHLSLRNLGCCCSMSPEANLADVAAVLAKQAGQTEDVIPSEAEAKGDQGSRVRRDKVR